MLVPPAERVTIKFFYLLIFFCNEANNKEYYIITTTEDVCPMQPCTTLSNIATNNFSEVLASDNVTVLNFLAGNHSLSVNLSIVNTNSFIMYSSTASVGTVVIECKKSSHIFIRFVRYVFVSNIEFVGCGGNTLESVDAAVLLSLRFEGLPGSRTALQLIETSTKIMNCTFTSNTVGSFHEQIQYHIIFTLGIAPSVMAGGALVSIHSNVSISHSIFDNNRAEVGGAILAKEHSNINVTDTWFMNNFCTTTVPIPLSLGGAMYIEESSLAVSESIFYNNSVLHNGGAVVVFLGVISISNSRFTNNLSLRGSGGVMFLVYSSAIIQESRLEKNSGYFGAGVLVAYSSILEIKDSNFSFNRAAAVGGVIGIGCGHLMQDNSFSVRSTVIGKSSLRIYQCNFSSNAANIGGVIFSLDCKAIIRMCHFHHNSASDKGGVVYILSSTIAMSDCSFNSNKANEGAVIATQESKIDMDGCTFSSNTAILLGGVIFTYHSGNITIKQSQFKENTVSYGGGVLQLYNNTIHMDECSFISNIATVGGALLAVNCNLTIKSCQFLHNTALLDGESYREEIIRRYGTSYFYNTANHGGALSISNCSVSILKGSPNSSSKTLFTHNKARRGAALYALNSTLTILGLVTIKENSATEHSVVYVTESIGHFMGMLVISNNTGSLLAYNSNITFTGKAVFQNGSPVQENFANIEEGGAITLYQSNVIFKGEYRMEYNEARNGGAMLVTESKVFVSGRLLIANNKALLHGGGVHLFQSELNCQKNCLFQLMGNNATENGGGIHAISSLIKISCTMIGTYYFTKSFTQFEKYSGEYLIFINNSALRGGGLSLETNSKLYVLKRIELNFDNTTSNIMLVDNVTANTVQFISNIADMHGGAVYINDNTDSGTCTSTSSEVTSQTAECFLQVLALHTLRASNIYLIHYLFSQNFAKISGSTLYGGLLDRCTLSPFSEVHNKYGKSYFDGLMYFNLISTNISEHSISSHPVQVCICMENYPNCSFDQHGYIEVKKGEIFTISLVAVDQMYKSVDATIQGYLESTDSNLIEGQVTQVTSNQCENISFRIFSPHAEELLTLYASDGPCKDAKLSTKIFNIQFLPCTCPVGFQPMKLMNDTECSCECHDDIAEYVQCNSTTKLLIRRSNTWITNVTNQMDINAEIRYLVYDHCPYDYCSTITTSINLNVPNGVDAQCAFNRTGILCGSCKPGLSLSLGSSLCLKCPDHWPVQLISIIIAATLAGLVLVTALLLLNMTVAVGTLSAIIFYANIIASNRSLLLPFSQSNFVTVFISWLNLELGIDTCLFHTMDSYHKTWLQLAFPIYLIVLVASIIIISDHSPKFSRLFRKKNPVATLATLVLLSYTKILQIVIAALSFGVLKYPDGSKEMIWLPDPSIKYISGKHIPLFIVALLILLIGAVYTTLLFLWQWLLRIPKSYHILKWIDNTKVYNFIETYHAPYAPKHRYWIGMLLFVRAVVYIVSAVNVSSNPQVAFLSIVYSVSFIVLLKGFIASRVYKNTANDVLDMFMYLNILLFVTFTWYSFNSQQSQEALQVAYISVCFTFSLLITITLYHVYMYTIIFAKIRQITKQFHKFLKDCIKNRTHDAPKLQKDNDSPPVTESTITMSQCESCDDTMGNNDTIHTESDKNSCSNGVKQISNNQESTEENHN